MKVPSAMKQSGWDCAARAMREAQSRALLEKSDTVSQMNAAARNVCLSAPLPQSCFLV